MAAAPEEPMDRVRFHQLCVPQLRSAGFPASLYDTLSAKIDADVFDCGNSFALAQVEDDDGNSEGVVLVASQDIPASSNVWLVDHAWTFRIRDCKRQMRDGEALRHRIAAMLNVPERDDVDRIYDSLWKVVNHYHLGRGDGSATDEECVWYVPDEVGAAIRTAASPSTANCRRVPLLVPWKDLVVDVVWAIADMEEGDWASADRWEYYRTAGPAVHEAICAITDNIDDDDALATCNAALAELRSAGGVPFVSVDTPLRPPLPPAGPRPIKVYTDSKLVFDHLTDDDAGFVRVENAEDADALWLAHTPLTRSDDFPHAKFVSQFPEERHFVTKSALAKTIQGRYGRPVPWLPLTFDATNSEVLAFVAEFLRRAHGGVENNVWITKPHNLARSMDMNVSESLPWLLRYAETGPKVISKYVDRPCLFRQRKCDMRFVVMLRSLQPLELYVHDNFLFRFAAEPFALNDYEIYEKHFTVMNYRAPERVVTLHDVDFIREFNEYYASKGATWTDCLKRIHDAIRGAFAAVPVDEDVPHDRFRAIYGVDIILEADFTPKLLEITFSPDNKRLCKQRPSVYNEIFQTLFFGATDAVTRIA